ncbi:hypothetical protein COCSUDRAFT_59450 [Coccomyxa subellipsoidea C-169]|uniref:Transmembrane protein n=1 Tax=Coccomyxa subellipsoidea (strain C-169) TaxID=574566 RepID=I0Z8I7_COCSC|nr:hypothetical protein COCSUDRAFT_59450 [Coccomyxa subellipsoidea C-169]EIE26956.1 hypothetical protein COCSUDRAFT_59450 [Coccomyxa subellipsoidea C-169]|eukprot:XP_005651500.1 hypothetical protein COCSUDRAFT_59450 [Coccomyxa subellipsoidea C-169]
MAAPSLPPAVLPLMPPVLAPAQIPPAQPMVAAAKYFTFIFFGLSCFVILLFGGFVVCHCYRRLRLRGTDVPVVQMSEIPGGQAGEVLITVPIKEGRLVSHPDGGMEVAFIPDTPRRPAPKPAPSTPSTGDRPPPSSAGDSPSDSPGASQPLPTSSSAHVAQGPAAPSGVADSRAGAAVAPDAGVAAEGPSNNVRLDEYWRRRHAQVNLDRQARKLDEIKAQPHAPGPQGKAAKQKKVEKLDRSIKMMLTKELGPMKFKQSLLMGATLLLLFRYASGWYSGHVVAKLPFEPFSLLAKLAHRGIPTPSANDCSFAFVYALCQAGVRPNLTKLLDLGLTRRMIEMSSMQAQDWAKPADMK